jgi:hypothetical protein
MCLQAGAISTISTSRTTEPTYGSLNAGNTLISADNPDGDDINPKIIRGQGSTLVVTYEKSMDIFSRTNPIVWSQDNGETWTTQFEMDSLIFDLSGILQSPDIVYVPGVDQFYYTAVDPVADMYNNLMFWIPGDIANAEDAAGYAISGSGSSNYLSAAAGATENWGIAATTEDGYDFIQLFGLGYFTYPDFESPPVMGGFYYDGNSEHNSAPAAQLEMASNSNRIFLVSEQTDEGKISMKSTANDEAMLTNGESQNGMDKYADIEQWPGEFIADGTDPDVAGSGDMVYVVYTAGGDVKCSYSSTDAGTYDPGFSWQTSTVATGAGFAAVHAMGNVVKVGYVKDNNVFLVESDDGGETWGDPMQMNNEDGSASAEPGAVALNDLGIVWVDTRNGAKDIYTAAGGAVPIIEVKSISGGLGVSAVIGNSGEADAEDVVCTITIDAPLMILGGETTDTINVAAGTEQTISTGFILGIGPAEITVNAGGVIKTASGTVLGPLVIGM